MNQASILAGVVWLRTVLALIAVALALAVVLAGEAAAEGRGGSPFWWGGAISPNMVAEAGALPADPGSVAPLWEVRLGSHQYSIPTLAGGRVYVGADDAAIQREGYMRTGGGAVLCLDRATGRLVWQLPIPRYEDGLKAPYHFDQWKCGVCSGPLVNGDRVYVIGNRGDVLCLDKFGQANGNDGPFLNELEYMGLAKTPGAKLEPADGDILWRYDMLTETGLNGHDVVGSTLLLHGDLLYACTSNGIDDRHHRIPKPLVPSLIVLDKRNGQLLAWDDEKIGQRMLHCNWSSPSAARVGDRTLILFGGGDGNLYAFAEPAPPFQPGVVQTLKKVWSCECNPPGYRTRDGQPLPYSRSERNSPEGPSEIIGTAVFYEGRVYVALGQSPVHGVGQGCLWCVDAATGAPVWSSQLVERTLATVAIADGLLYIPDYTGTLHCFDAATGQRVWSHPLESKTWCASCLVADGKVYLGTEANFLWVLKAGREKQVLSKTRLKSTPITLTAAEGVLYLPLQNSLVALPDKPAAKPAGASGASP